MKEVERLTRRERQVMDIIFALREGTVNEVREKLPEAASYSAVRAVLNRLVSKGELNYSEQGPRYLYSPAVNVSTARKSALKKLTNTFFGGSALQTMTALLGEASEELSAEELAELEDLIAQAKKDKEGRQ